LHDVTVNKPESGYRIQVIRNWSLIMAALRRRCGHYIFALWFLSIFLSFFLA